MSLNKIILHYLLEMGKANAWGMRWLFRFRKNI